MYLVYTDDSILAGPNNKEINQIIKDLKLHKSDLTVLGNLKYFLGVNITKEDNGRIHVSQPHLIDQIIKQSHLTTARPRSTPILYSQILHRYESEPDYTPEFGYRSIVGKMNYLECATRCDISYNTHQCAQFSASPKQPHTEAIRWLSRYLKDTRNKGYYIDPKSE